MTPGALQRANEVFTGAATVVIAVVVAALGLFSPGAWLFAAWAASPFAALFLAPRIFQLTRAGIVLVLSAAVAVAGFSAWLLYSAFVAHPDAQAGLVVLFLPVWELPFVGVVVLVAAWLSRKRSVA